MKVHTLIAMILFVGSAALANPSDPPCKPIDPDIDTEVDWLRETPNVVLFSDRSNEEEYSSSVIGPCRTSFTSGTSEVNCLYVAHENLNKLAEIIIKDGIPLRGLVINNFEYARINEIALEYFKSNEEILLLGHGRDQTPSELIEYSGYLLD